MAHRRPRNRALSVVAVLGLMAGMVASMPTTASAAGCLATDGAFSSTDLQAAIDQATAGDTIVIQGTCVGNFTVYIGNLTLTSTQKATLDGNASGRVLLIGFSGGVTLRNLLITNGSSGSGGAIFNDGDVLLTGATEVSGNTADSGGGITNEGHLKMSGNARVTGNTARIGGGIISYGDLQIFGNAHVNGNAATQDGGGIFVTGNTARLRGNAHVNGNTANARGGGIYNNGYTVKLSVNTQVSRNAADTGGGVYNNRGTVKMYGSALVSDNTAQADGGGIYRVDGTLVGTIAGVNVKSNVPNDIAP
jgi:hypothetical protein